MIEVFVTRLAIFERKYIPNSLGGSNEPFLNKPARFKELSPINAVRRGEDKKKLDLLCEFLPKLKTKELAWSALTDALRLAILNFEKRQKLLSIQPKTINSTKVIKFLTEFVETSCEGETLSLASGVVMVSLKSLFGSQHKVLVHNVNQAGSSSNEVSDIDVYLGNQLFIVEAKDKKFTSEDVKHALNKVKLANLNKLFFVLET